MNAHKITDEDLLNYIDGDLSPEECSTIEAILADSSKLQTRLAELKNVDVVLSEIKLKSPSRNFSFNVMQSLEQSSHSFGKGGLIILIATVFTVLVASYFMVGGFIDLSAIKQLNVISDLNRWVPKSLNLNIINNILLFALTILALLVFDKTVLKPFFKGRKYT